MIFLHKFFLIFLAALLAFSAFNVPVLALSERDISAKSAVVIERETGKILFEKNPYIELPMASTTKIMTGILALENADENAVVKISPKAASVEGSSIYLAPGEEIKMIDLVYGLMLNSGNDAAIAIAEYVSGSTDEFAKLMTEKAHAIGCEHTSFKNPNGLDAEGHYTTAYDLALIARYALSNQRFAQVVATKQKSIPRLGVENARYLKNHNKLLFTYEGCNGVKTGFTKASGRTLVSSATGNGKSAICVTLNAPNDWKDHTLMLDYAFENIMLNQILTKGDVLKTIPVKHGTIDKVNLVAADDFVFPDTENLSFEFQTGKFMEAPVTEGQMAGTVFVKYNGKTVGTIELISHDAVPRVEKRETLFDMSKRIFKKWLLAVSKTPNSYHYLKVREEL